MKKYFNELLVGCSAVLSILVLLFMLAPGISSTILGTKVTTSVYELISYNDTVRAGLLIALIFTILSLLGSACLGCMKFLKIKFDYAWLVAFVLALFSLVAGILFFCTRPIVGVDGSSTFHLGAGAVLSGIASILAACPLAYYGLKTKK